MPDNRSELKSRNQSPAEGQEGVPHPTKTTGLRRWFPWVASALVVSGNLIAAYRVNIDVMAGKLSGLPYLCLTALFLAIFAAHYFVYRDK